MNRYRLQWTGLTGLPGVSTFYQDATGSAPSMPGALKTLFEVCKAYLPNGSTITYPSTMDVVDAATGKTTSTLGITPPAATSGTAVGNWNPVTGVELRWDTNQYIGGRRVKGRTFLVPSSGSLQSSSGVPTAADRTTLATAAQAYITTMTGTAVVYRKPWAGSATRPAYAGSFWPITVGSCPAEWVVLRSRRN